MVHASTFDSKEESADVVKRKDLEDKLMVENSEDSSISKAPTQESDRILFQAAVTAIVITIDIGLFTVCAVVFWIWKEQMAKENSLKTNYSSEDEHKPGSSEDKSELRNGHVDGHFDKNLNRGSTRSSAGPQHDAAAKENERPSVQVHSNSQHFSNVNRNPLSEQPENITQIASTEMSTPSKHLNKRTLTDVDTEDTTQQVVSLSLQYLTELNKPKEIIDGSISSKSNDMFMFPQDDDLALASEPCSESLTVKLPSQTDTNRQDKKRELVLSKSLDLHRISLEKGRKLLETKPSKSSLRRHLSAECLMPKEVHFPEDIRNIRKIHKYDSLDDIIFLKKDTDKSEDEAKT